MLFMNLIYNNKEMVLSKKHTKINLFLSTVIFKCRFDQMSFGSNVVSVKCRLINCRSTQ